MHLLLSWALVLLVAGKAGAIQPSEICRGDFNSDGRVDFADFVTFAGVFGMESGQESYNARGDFDSNGRVDFADFVAFAGVFGMECPEVSPDREALVAVYNASDGSNWRTGQQVNWLSSLPLGEWSGVTTNDSGRVVALNLSSRKITDVSMLDSLTALTRLELQSNTITDISALSGLVNLTYLNLAHNAIKDVSALELLTGLTALGLWNNAITDISALAGMARLKVLFLAQNGITDIAALDSLTNVTVLELQDNAITDISPLGNLTRLETLNLQNNNVTEISALEGLTDLKTLALRGNPLSHTALSAHIPGLMGRGVEVQFDANDRALLVALYNANRWDDGTYETHWLSSQPLEKWWGVATDYSGRVMWLTLMFKDIEDISALAGLTRLRHLYLLSNEIEDISALSGLTELETLQLSFNNVEDISALASLTNLQDLDLAYNNVMVIPALGNLTKLETLKLQHNSITDISGLSGLTGLREVELQENAIRKIPSLSGLTKLETFDLHSNDIDDISGISGVTGLETLNLGYNNVADVSALGSLARLKTLALQDNVVSDVASLASLGNLESLELQGNILNNAAIDDHIPSLASRGVEVGFDRIGKGEFDVELVFLDNSYNEWQKRVLQYAVRRWTSVITDDQPDFVFSQAWSKACGYDSYRIPIGERIDDLRIYVSSFPFPRIYSSRVLGVGGPSLIRRATGLPLVGCIAFRLDRVTDAEFREVAIHEIGHALGFIEEIWDSFGFLQDTDDERHFSGPRAIAAFDAAGGRGYSGAKVPVASDKAHWKLPVLAGELMGPTGGDRGEDGGALSAITIQSLADLGYGVDLTYAHAYTLPGAIPAAKIDTAAHICGAGLYPEPIDVVDEEGRILQR